MMILKCVIKLSGTRVYAYVRVYTRYIGNSLTQSNKNRNAKLRLIRTRDYVSGIINYSLGSGLTAGLRG